MKRRTFIGTSVVAAAGIVACKNISTSEKDKKTMMKDTKNEPLKGNINHGVCFWCYGGDLETFLIDSKNAGVTGVDLMGEKEWPLLKKHGVHSSMCNGAEISLTEGWCNPKNHETLVKNYSDLIPKVAEAGYTNIIAFSGNRNGIDDTTGLKNCADGLKKIMPLAEEYDIVIQMELLNSKVDHKDYMCDHSEWGVALCKEVASENFKLLYDIYHMQIMEGDVIRTIKKHHHYFGHYHTGGNPGRNEINDTQELFYPAIMKAILETGYKGYVSQEFIPTWKDKIAALKDGIKICDV